MPPPKKPKCTYKLIISVHQCTLVMSVLYYMVLESIPAIQVSKQVFWINLELLGGFWGLLIPLKHQSEPKRIIISEHQYTTMVTNWHYMIQISISTIQTSIGACGLILELFGGSRTPKMAIIGGLFVQYPSIIVFLTNIYQFLWFPKKILSHQRKIFEL